MSAIAGIDPGVTGAIGFVGEYATTVFDMPSNPQDLADLIKALPTVSLFVVEQSQPMPRQGVVSTFKTGQGYGQILGVLAALCRPYVLVTPAKWKKGMGLDNDKEKSRALARSLWPTAALSRKKDHGRAEALLIAEWWRRQEEKR